ncbi:MAG: hypothetical protein WKF52_06825 [Sphingomicrobium sp.]
MTGLAQTSRKKALPFPRHPQAGRFVPAPRLSGRRRRIVPSLLQAIGDDTA